MNRNRRDDLAFAAAQAQGNEPDLPTVDDLEVAALAAAAGMSDSQTSSETSSSEAEDDDEGDSSESESGRSDANAPAAERVQLQLNFNGDRVSVALNPLYSLDSRKPSKMDMDSSSSDDDDNQEDMASSSSSSDDDDEETGDMIEDYTEIKGIIDGMDDEDGFGGGANGPPATAVSELFGDLPPPALTGIEVTEADILTPAGTIISVIEGMAVVRAATGSRALDEGTILVLENRSILGAVEEVFGPVNAPLYALRCIQPSDMSEGESLNREVKPEMGVFSVDRLSSYVLPEALKVKGYDGDGVEDGADEASELHFSDDEAEAEYKRKLKAKRKEAAEISPNGGGPKKVPQRTGSSRGRGGGRGRGQYQGGYHQQQQQYNAQQQQQYAMYQNQQQQYYAAGGYPVNPQAAAGAGYMQQPFHHHPAPPQQQQQYAAFRLAQPQDFHPAYAAPPQQPYPGLAQPPPGAPQRVFSSSKGNGRQQQFQTLATAGQLSAMSMQQTQPESLPKPE